jgi:limonene-1,2-epoxide hydrolase/ketosteroid isomerase-like protein
MPWFPDFVGAAELARRQRRAAGQADPVGQYLSALSHSDSRSLEDVWPGQVVIYDPRAGEVSGHRQLHEFISRNVSWLAGLHARTETVASTVADGRAVVELLGHLTEDGRDMAWPVAVVAESPDDQSVVFRTYCSQWPVLGHREVRPPILPAAPVHPGDVVGRHLAALAAGDTGAIVATFSPDGYFQEPLGFHQTHRGPAELRSFYDRMFSAGGGLDLQACCMTDDGVRCAVEFNWVRWGRHAIPPQAGISVYERGPDGLLAAVRSYQDVAPPAELS